MWPDWVSNLGHLALESDAQPTAPRGPAFDCATRPGFVVQYCVYKDLKLFAKQRSWPF